MSKPFMKDFLVKLIVGGLATQSSFQGATENEISFLESKFKVRLPQAYRDYLSALGHERGNFLQGLDVAYERLVDLQDWSQELIQETGSSFVLPSKSFVFLMSQGCAFLFFDTTNGDDPPVYLFDEQEKQPKKVSNTFTGWLSETADEEIEIVQKLSKKPPLSAAG